MLSFAAFIRRPCQISPLVRSAKTHVSLSHATHAALLLSRLNLLEPAEQAGLCSLSASTQTRFFGSRGKKYKAKKKKKIHGIKPEEQAFLSSHQQGIQAGAPGVDELVRDPTGGQDLAGDRPASGPYIPPLFHTLTRDTPAAARAENWKPVADDFAVRQQRREHDLDRKRAEWAPWIESRRQRPPSSERAFARMQSASPLPWLQRPSERRDPIQPPSKASGGVPEPTATYLAQAAVPPAPPLDAAQPLLVVLDLNGTLLHRPEQRTKPTQFAARRHALRFLSYCLDNFWVVVWSSARPANVDRILRQLVPREDHRRRIVAVWARDHLGLCPADYRSRVQCYKRLSWLWADPAVAQSHPHYAIGGRWSQANTVLVDDSAEKARTEPHNTITIPEYRGPGDQTNSDRVLPEVHDYLNHLCFQPDVSSYIRERPFRSVSGLY